MLFMQILQNITKNFLLILLSCSLLITWQSSIEVMTWRAAYSDDSIWSSVARELKLDHQAQSSRVQAEINKLLADRNELYRILKSAGPYIYFIFEQTKAKGLPAEIALVPFIESEFNPNDRSKKGALGLWQLMSGTAHELGVKIKSGYDGRKNIIASTHAALAYFKDLGSFFKGDWYLALAAYNCGQGRVKSVEKRSGSHNFWNLALPKETKFYVPKLLAVSAIIKNPDKYGVTLPPINNKPYFKQVTVNDAANLNKIAESSGADIKVLHALNPDYKKMTVPKQTAVLIPIKSDNKA